MNIILFGAPGAGKGTQSSLLVERLKMLQISTGDLFRAAIKNKTALGVKAQSYMDQGKLVPDEVVIGMVDEVLEANKSKNFILDGFPRTVAQAEALEKMLVNKGMSIGKAIFLEVSQAALLKRLAGRRVCKACGAVYHIEGKPTAVAGKCDVCGGEVYQRSDDKEDVIETRLKTYSESTFPLKDYYKKLNKYYEVSGQLQEEEVFQEIKKHII